MRIYSNCRELMSEMARELNSYGAIVKPKTYQNKVIEGNDEFQTKELICQQYALTNMPDPDFLFIYTHTREWADVEFSERISGEQLNPGKAWELNPDMWEQFLVGEIARKFDYTYAERINNPSRYKDQYYLTCLEAIIKLLKDDPDTRKAVLPIFGGTIDPYYRDLNYTDTDHYDGSGRIPCSMYYDFLIRDNNKGPQLNICYHQRSADFVGHFGDDVYLAWKLMKYVANSVGVKPGYLFHTIDSLHVYKKDWEILSNSIDDYGDKVSHNN